MTLGTVPRIVAAALCLALCLALRAAPDAELATIAAWLPGTYDTFAQASADESSSATYQHVRAVLTVTPVALTAPDPDAFAFYLEQALEGQEREPYRQRVIVLRRRNGTIINELYRPRDARSLVGFAGATPLSLGDFNREAGCDASWERASDSTFRGSAGMQERCPSTLRGATHARSTFALSQEFFVTLDQGLADDGAVHWGPPLGVQGHVFVKRPHARAASAEASGTAHATPSRRVKVTG